MASIKNSDLIDVFGTGTGRALTRPCLWVKAVGCLLKHSSALMSPNAQERIYCLSLRFVRSAVGVVGVIGKILMLSDCFSPTCEALIQA